MDILNNLENKFDSEYTLREELYCSFVWWYCDHYLDCGDPFGYWGKKKVDRVIKIHIKLNSSTLEKEIQLFLAFLPKWSIDYDCLANFPLERSC